MRPHEIACHQTQPQQFAIILSLDPSLFWFRGHFTVQPLLPGVAQIDWVMYYATKLLVPGWRFHSIKQLKFQSPLLPKMNVTLKLHWQQESQILSFSYQYQGSETQHTASNGKIRLCQ